MHSVSLLTLSAASFSYSFSFESSISTKVTNFINIPLPRQHHVLERPTFLNINYLSRHSKSSGGDALQSTKYLLLLRVGTCYRVLLRQANKRVTYSWLIVSEAGGWDVAQHFIGIGWFHLHCYFLQQLVIQSVGTIKLKSQQQKSGKE